MWYEVVIGVASVIFGACIFAYMLFEEANDNNSNPTDSNDKDE